MFEPGHLHIFNAPIQPSDPEYDIHIRYEVCDNPEFGRSMHFTMQGEIAGKPFEDEFELPRDLAYNFAHNANQIAVKHGLPSIAVLPLTRHKEYDRMFNDIRDTLGVHSGDPVDPKLLPDA